MKPADSFLDKAFLCDGEPVPQRFRTIWISDVHLGTSGCQAGRCWTSCARPNRTRCTWSATSSTAGSCKRRWYWAQAHNDVVQKVLKKAQKGTRGDLRARQS